MRIVAASALAVLLSAAPLSAGIFDDEDCRHSAPRKVATPAAGVTRVVIHAEAGSLTVSGTQGAAQIVASGTACTSDGDMLEKMTLTMRRSGGDLHIEASIPDKVVFFGFYSSKLDFSVVLPAGLPVSIEDDSGWMKVSDTGTTTIDDDSGAIETRNVRGNLTINDDSGEIDVDGVAGNLEIEDDSGEIDVRNVAGAVRISDDSGAIIVSNVRSLHIRDDDSGSIVVKKVKGDVVIDEDASGSVEVSDVGGSFTVSRKSSGSIDYVRVAGKVSVPREF